MRLGSEYILADKPLKITHMKKNEIMNTPCHSLSEETIKELLESAIHEDGHCSVDSFFRDCKANWNKSPAEILADLNHTCDDDCRSNGCKSDKI